jgi:DNA repair protein RecO (recombination protein O)
MKRFATPGIMLRRIDYGDYDLICTFYTKTFGKQTAMAKSAKRSVKRFGGSLELFSIVNITCRAGRGKGLPYLEEAALIEPFMAIRSDIRKTAYASYWVELVDKWSEAGVAHEPTFSLLARALAELNGDRTMAAVISIWFQMNFMKLAGFGPTLSECSLCHNLLEQIDGAKIRFDLKRGGLVCNRCAELAGGGPNLAKGVIKQLLWIGGRDLETARRMRFSAQGLVEGLHFLEAFVPFHLDKEPRSLKFLKQVR